MKIAAARARLVRLRFARPVVTARGEFRERASVLLELRDAEGRAGLGEAAPWPGFRTESESDALRVLEGLAQDLAGVELDPRELPEAMAARLAATPAARTALHSALWDLDARRAGRALARHLVEATGPGCGPVLASVPANALLAGATPAALRADATRVRAAGYGAAKIKLGTARLADDVERARAAREVLGPAIRLRGDANGAWSRDEARAALAALAEFDFEYVEQPLPADDVAGLVALRGHVPIRIAADESVVDAQGVGSVLAAGAADVLVLKPALLGGAAIALDLARQARRAGCDVVFTHAFESGVGARHALHCAAAWGDPAAIHGLVTEGLFADDIAPGLAARNGAIDVPREPGIGVTP